MNTDNVTETAQDSNPQFRAPSESEINEFIQYVLGFYGPGEAWSRFFKEAPITEDDVRKATAVLLKHYRIVDPEMDSFQADTWCREHVRDLMLRARGHLDLEHAVVHQIAALEQLSVAS